MKPSRVAPFVALALFSFNLNPGFAQIPCPNDLKLGDSAIKPDCEIRVPNYNSALDHLSREIFRNGRAKKVLVVWLLDESASMQDDHHAIKKGMGTLIKELNRGKSDWLSMAVAGFGRSYHRLTKKPTRDWKQVTKAIDSIRVDKTGNENTFTAAVQVMREYKAYCEKHRTKLMLVIATDESGDDESAVELAIHKAKQMNASVYVLGRESVFGSPYAYVRWQQPVTKRIFWLRIRRGPETPFAELLQHDGFRRRRVSHQSGFAPYAQARLCKETGGLFLQFPHELTSVKDFAARTKKLAKALKGYEPSRHSRAEYKKERASSRFRQALFGVLMALNPYSPTNKFLELPHSRYQRFSTDPDSFKTVVARREEQVLKIIGVYERAIILLERIKPLRARESSARWRANYDLLLAQAYWYRLRLRQYGIALNQFVRVDLKKLPAKHDRWAFREDGRKLKLPDAIAAKRFGVTPEQCKRNHKAALALLEKVVKQHPGTPWSDLAKRETQRPFSLTFSSSNQKPAKAPGNRKGGPFPPRL